MQSINLGLVFCATSFDNLAKITNKVSSGAQKESPRFMQSINQVFPFGGNFCVRFTSFACRLLRSEAMASLCNCFGVYFHKTFEVRLVFPGGKNLICVSHKFWRSQAQRARFRKKSFAYFSYKASFLCQIFRVNTEDFFSVLRCAFYLRSERDSNPRYRFLYTQLAIELFRPLRHHSIRCPVGNVCSYRTNLGLYPRV